LQTSAVEEHDHIDSMDQLTKHLRQTQSVINTLVADEHFNTIKSSDLANMLWLIDDGLDSISKASNELIAHIQNNKTD
jgi:hypothetical protein